MTGFEEAYRGRVLAGLPVELAQAFAKAGVGSLSLKVRLGTPEAIDEALELLTDDKTLLTTRIELAQVFGEIDEPRSTPVLLKLLQAEPNVPLQSAALTSLQGDPSETVAREVLRVYSTLQPEVREVALTLLVSRKSWAAMLLTAIDNGEIEGSTIPVDTIRKLAVHQDERMAQLMKKHFGEIRGATNVELGQRIEQLAALLSDRAGDVYAGKQLFADSCGKCHQLFREGGNLGPDLTQYQREDVQRMLLHVVNPNIEIREGFETYMILTDEGRVVSGFIADQDQQVIVMRGSDGQTSTISRDTIEDMSRQSVSMMPEGLLDQMTDEQVSDLFAYLRASQPIFK
jgi:putative heme-binding domain-containing protein